MRIADSSDHRIELISEVLRAIKVIKLYAWENSFVKWVLSCSSFREMENGHDKEEDKQYHDDLAMAFLIPIIGAPEAQERVDPLSTSPPFDDHAE